MGPNVLLSKDICLDFYFSFERVEIDVVIDLIVYWQCKNFKCSLIFLIKKLPSFFEKNWKNLLKKKEDNNIN